MSCERIEPALDDYMDGDLSGERLREVERHVATCASCKTALASLRSLACAAAELRRGVAPDRDLWPGIRGAIATSRRQTQPRPAWGRWGALAASLILLSVATITVIRLADDGAAAPASEGATPVALAGTDAFQAVELEYVEATEMLLAAIEERRGQLSPETVDTLERNLAVIDEAIGEIRSTLDGIPEGPARERALTAMYKKKFDLLRRVSRLSL